MKEFHENQLTKLVGRDLQAPFHVTIQLTVDDSSAAQQKLLALLGHLQGTIREKKTAVKWRLR